MATPIKETPILRGKDAEAFTKNMENVQKFAPARQEQIKSTYKRLKAKERF